MKSYQVSPDGFYGKFGGAFVPDSLRLCVEDLQKRYLQIMNDPAFKSYYYEWLVKYVGRPTPLYLSEKLSRKYGCKIYLKREDLNHTGAHKINNALGQALLAQKLGKKRIIAETGAGQHGVAVATVCALLEMECKIFMGKTDIERQRVNVEKMKLLGAEIISVESGTQTLQEAVDEALNYWSSHYEDTFYLIGSAVGPHPYPDMVAKFQSVISEELEDQLMELEGRNYPDYLIACIGGGSNAAGTVYQYVDNENVKIVLAEAGGKGIGSGKSAATLHIGKEGLIHGYKTIVLQDNEGNIKDPYSISAGLDYPGIGPLHAHLADTGRASIVAVNDDEAIDAALELVRFDGIIPALESSHALGALPKMQFRPDDVVVLTLSGRGDKDIEVYLGHK